MMNQEYLKATKKFKKEFLIILFVLLLISVFNNDVLAQGCSQCRMVPKSDLDGGGHIATKLNTGILYLLVMPYIFLSVIGFIYRKPIAAFIKNRRAAK